MKRRQKFFGVVLALGLVCFLATAVAAQNFPTKAITMVTGTGSGGGVDRMTRAVQRFLPEVIGQTVLVENRGGAAGSIGMRYVLDQPDGYFIYAYHQPGITEIIKRNPKKFKLDDLAYININWIDFTILIAQKKLGWKSLGDFIEAAKKEPGKYSFAAPSAGSAGTVIAKMLFDELGLNIKIVPYDSGGTARAAFQGGHTHLTSGGAAGMLVVGDMAQPLGVFWKDKIKAWPDTPTINSQLEKYGKKIPNVGSYRLFAIPREVRDKHPERWNTLVSAFKKLVTEHKGFIEFCQKQEIDTDWYGPEESWELVKEVHDIFIKVD